MPTLFYCCCLFASCMLGAHWNMCADRETVSPRPSAALAQFNIPSACASSAWLAWGPSAPPACPWCGDAGCMSRPPCTRTCELCPAPAAATAHASRSAQPLLAASHGSPRSAGQSHAWARAMMLFDYHVPGHAPACHKVWGFSWRAARLSPHAAHQAVGNAGAVIRTSGVTKKPTFDPALPLRMRLQE